MALVYDDPGAWERMSEEEQQAAFALYGALADEARAAGVLVHADALAATTAATSVRVRDGETLVTDGPYAEVKESLGGYYLFDCASMEEAVEWAARIPSASHGGAIEVRPVNVDDEEEA